MQPWESCDHVLTDSESLVTTGPLRELWASSLLSKYTMTDTMSLENISISPFLTCHRGKGREGLLLQHSLLAPPILHRRGNF